jgi:electron transfer flavoprotein beta subunit
MASRKKPLEVFEPVSAGLKTRAIKYYQPPSKSACKYVDAENVEELVNLLHSEAKVI